MTCQSYHCAQGRQLCPTPYTCRDACATLRTANSDGTDPQSTTPSGPKPASRNTNSRTDAIGLFFLRWACVLAALVVLGMLAGYLSAKLA